MGRTREIETITAKNLPAFIRKLRGHLPKPIKRHITHPPTYLVKNVVTVETQYSCRWSPEEDKLDKYDSCMPEKIVVRLDDIAVRDAYRQITGDNHRCPNQNRVFRPKHIQRLKDGSFNLGAIRLAVSSALQNFEKWKEKVKTDMKTEELSSKRNEQARKRLKKDLEETLGVKVDVSGYSDSIYAFTHNKGVSVSCYGSQDDYEETVIELCLPRQDALDVLKKYFFKAIKET